MSVRNKEQWERFKKYHLHSPGIGLSLDISRMNFDDGFLAKMEPAMQSAFAEMAELEKGGIANPDENRMVGHYWLRNEDLAPTADITEAIREMKTQVRAFARKVHSGAIQGAGGRFENVLVIGIGGSALGPQFVSRALSNPTRQRAEIYFLDNTDPDGIDLVLSRLEASLSKTLSIVISKSGGTKETRNGMLEVKRAYEEKGLRFEDHAVAITGAGSELDKTAVTGVWLERFPMWDWVGGRTSELSAVGLLPAELQGIDSTALLDGAKACDTLTRVAMTRENPAALMALMWFAAGNGKGEKDLVVLPYKDRLELFSKYLQQLIMESLGKELDRDGRKVNQGIAVFGNKGATDQHAYVQQLRDGLNSFFVTFINVLEDRGNDSMVVDPGVTTGDYLNGFFMGTRGALYENSRQSMTITVDRLDSFKVGALIALFERSVGFYASLINVNAYHQPGVEAGKKAAAGVLLLQRGIVEIMKRSKGSAYSVEDIASLLGENVDREAVFLVCEHLAGSHREGISRNEAEPLWKSTYQIG